MLRKTNSAIKSATLPLVIMVVAIFSSCTTFLDDEKYSGPPHSLKYMAAGDYPIGYSFLSEVPSVMGGENATFSIVAISGPADEDVMQKAFTIIETAGNINVEEYNQLLPGEYTLDVKVTNPYGSTTFENAYTLTAVQVAPTALRYSPVIYSFYGSSIGDQTVAASVNGGGPYTFVLNDDQNYFTIDEETGVITKLADIQIEDDEVLTKVYDVEVSNDLGSYLAEEAITIEIIGVNVGRIKYNIEYSTANANSLGLLNATGSTYIGSYTEMINDKSYTTELTETDNGATYNGSRYLNSWGTYTISMKMDKTGNGEIEDQLVLNFKTKSSQTECVAMVVSDEIDLTGVETANTDIVAFKRYIDSNVNQKFSLLACDADMYDADDMFSTDWTTIEENIAPGMLAWSSPVSEAKLYSDGKQSFDIPAELIGKNIRLALKAVHLNPGLGNLGRETYIYKWQVRAK